MYVEEWSEPPTVGIVLINKDNKILAVKEKCRDKIGPPKGVAIPSDVNDFAAAMRELEEETGVVFDPQCHILKTVVKLSESNAYTCKRKEKDIIIYVFDVVGPNPDINVNDKEEILWVNWISVRNINTNIAKGRSNKYNLAMRLYISSLSE